MEGLAYNLAGAEALVCPIMDARRQQAYYGIYDVSKEVPMEIEKPDAAPIEVVLQKAKETKREVIFLGDGVPVFQEKIKQCEGLLCRFAQTACGIRERLLSQRLERNIMSRADR